LLSVENCFFRGIGIWGESVSLVRFLGYRLRLVVVETVCGLIWDELMEKLNQKAVFFCKFQPSVNNPY